MQRLHKGASPFKLVIHVVTPLFSGTGQVEVVDGAEGTHTQQRYGIVPLGHQRLPVGLERTHECGSVSGVERGQLLSHIG